MIIITCTLFSLVSAALNIEDIHNQMNKMASKTLPELIKVIEQKRDGIQFLEKTYKEQ